MAKTNPLLMLAAGAAVGGGLIYALSDKKKAEPKAAALPIPPRPVPPAPGQGAYRSPMPNTTVPFPKNTEQRDDLDATICVVYRGFAEAPTVPQVVLGVLEAMAPQAEWPSISGDHWSMIALQAIVSMRVDQIAIDLDTGKTPVENFEDFCPQVATPQPKPPQIATPRD